MTIVKLSNSKIKDIVFFFFMPANIAKSYHLKGRGK